jgi:hypothetical protein
MKRMLTLLCLTVLISALAVAQFSTLATHNAYTTKATWTGPDSLMPYKNDQGTRTVWVTKDMDKDGKPEMIATDYANGGRVHVFEFTTPNKLELVWSSPRLGSVNTYSVPRWAQDGDLDGDGNREIIFPWGGRYTGKILVFEYNGADNSYGAVPGVADLELPATQFVATLGASSALRMDRETGTVYDFDGDGRDELITANQDNKVYILGVIGDVGGFGSWDIEGGDPAVNPENRFSGGSWWQSIPADIDGDTKMEIVNHYWNFYGFWSIDPKGTDTYRYPTPTKDSASVPGAAKKWHYHEYTRPLGSTEDAVAYMGTQVVDVDGDKKDEIAGILYIGSSAYDYQVSLTSLTKQDTGVYVWKDSTQFAIIGTNVWKIAGKTTGSFWGIGAYDFNKNNRSEIILGGSAGYNLIAMEYKGTGSILDSNSYTKTIYYPGDPAIYHNVDIYDSLGKKRDTVRYESPFVSKLIAGPDFNKNGKPDVMVAYQSVADSITYTHSVWDTTLIPKTWRKDSTWKIVNATTINIRLLEWSGSTFAPLDFEVVTPEQYVLEQNYPNPFNPTTSIRFSLPVDKRISLTVYDLLGKEVKSLINNEDYKQGAHSATWDGTNSAGQQVASGTYIYTLKYGSFSKSQKMMLLK